MENQTTGTDHESAVRVRTVKVPTELARELGIAGAFLYSYLVEKLTNPYSMEQMFTVKEVETETGLNEYHQRRLLKELAKRGLIVTGIKGSPIEKVDCVQEVE